MGKHWRPFEVDGYRLGHLKGQAVAVWRGEAGRHRERLGPAATEAEAKALIALTRVGLADRKNNLPSQLSGGQQQRVSIARAVAHDPHVLFADEPTANLDSASSKLVMEAFLDLHKEGQTIIMVTHEMEYAELAKRVVELKDGTIVRDRAK